MFYRPERYEIRRPKATPAPLSGARAATLRAAAGLASAHLEPHASAIQNLPCAFSPCCCSRPPSSTPRRTRCARPAPAGAVALLAAPPPQGEAAFTLALAYQSLGRHAAADSAFARADTLAPRVLAAWARSLESLGRLRDARLRLAAAHARDTLSAPIALAYARLLGESESWHAAQQVYARLLRPDSSNAYLLARLGYVYYKLGQPLDAIVHYERALQENPLDRGALLALTRIYLDSDAPFSARRSLDRLVGGFADEPDVWRRKGEIGLALQDYEYARDGYGQAVARGDTSAATLRGLGATHYLRADYAAADTMLGRAYRADSTDARTLYYLGMTRFAREDYPAALAFLTRTTELMDQPLLADVHGQMGAVYAAQNSDRDAIGAYRLARLLDPLRPDLLYHLATIYERYYKDPAPAREAYEQFLEMAPPETLPDQRRFARERLRALREAAHMRGDG